MPLHHCHFSLTAGLELSYATVARKTLHVLAPLIHWIRIAGLWDSQSWTRLDRVQFHTGSGAEIFLGSRVVTILATTADSKSIHSALFHKNDGTQGWIFPCGNERGRR